MHRRDFIRATSLSAAALALPRFAMADELPFNPTPAEGWRAFEVTTRVTPVSGTTHVWLPLPSLQDDAWIKPMGNLWRGNAADIRPAVDPVYGEQMLVASWPVGDGRAPELELVSRFSVRDRAVSFDQPERVPPQRKVVLEEKPGLTLKDEIVVAVREKLFGAWETNWLPYNTAHDLVLPGSSGPVIPFLMYPQGEADGRRLGSLDPQTFAYIITSKEITA